MPKSLYFAVRNLRLCTKDCLCLYVCPTGASDTENSIIDVDKCIGCGECAKACPSGAISIVPASYPAQQKKSDEVLAKSRMETKNKAAEEIIASALSDAADDKDERNLMAALAKAARLVNEDLQRESGYMLPQSSNTRKLLEALCKNPPKDDFPVETAKRLLELLPDNG